MKTKRRELTKPVPHREIDIFDEMDRIFDTMTHRGWLHPFHAMWPEWAGFDETLGRTTLQVEMIDRDEEVLVRAEVPGVDKKDLQVDLTDRQLRIQGERKKEKTQEKGELVHSEIAWGTFSRTIHLPEDVHAEKVKADFKSGILEIHLPKTHKTERRHIDVK